MKQVDINTIDDIIHNITEEELPRFIPDLVEFIEKAVKMKLPKTVHHELTWTDDNIQGVNIYEILSKDEQK